jgi:hypothetical protein
MGDTLGVDLILRPTAPRPPSMHCVLLYTCVGVGVACVRGCWWPLGAVVVALQVEFSPCKQMRLILGRPWLALPISL